MTILLSVFGDENIYNVHHWQDLLITIWSFIHRSTVKTKLKKTSGTQSVERTIALLKELATYGARGASVAELSSRAGLEYPTAHRIIRCLVEQRMVEKDHATRRYSLGPLVYELGLSVPSRMNLKDLCDPIIARIADNTGDTVFLNVRSGLDVLCVDRKEGAFPIKTLIFEIGNRRPLGVGASGIALLMRLTDEELLEVVKANASRFNSYGALNAKSILTHVRRARELGYVYTEDIVVPGVSAISLPFGGGNGVPQAAVAVACIPSRMPQSRHREIVSLLKTEIKALENVMRSASRLLNHAI